MSTGRWLLRIARLVCSTAAREDILEPLVADWQHDVRHSPPGTRRALARLSGAAAFWRTLLSCAVRDAVAPLPPQVWSPFARAFLLTLACVYPLLILHHWRVQSATGPSPLYSVVTLVTFGSAVAIGPAMRLARRARATRRDAARLLAMGIVISAAAVGWIGPWTHGLYASRSSRVAPAGTRVAVSRMTTAPLPRVIRTAADVDAPDRPRAFVELSLRSAVLATTLLCGVLGWLLPPWSRFGRDSLWFEDTSVGLWIVPADEILKAFGELTRQPASAMAPWAVPAACVGVGVVILVLGRFRPEPDRPITIRAR